MNQSQSSSLYQLLIAAGCQIDHHESDLYVKATSEASKIIEPYCLSNPIYKYTLFTSPIDNQQWWEIPFAYEPFWEGRTEFHRIIKSMTEGEPQGSFPTVTAANADWIVLKVRYNSLDKFYPWQIEVLANTGPNHEQELRHWSVPSIFDNARYDLSRAVMVSD